MWDYSFVVTEDGNWHTKAPWYAYSPTKLVLEEGITYIGMNAFYECNLTGSLILPKGLTEIGEDAFSGCNGLTSVTIPQGVTSICDAAFADCQGLTSVVIPEGVTRIGASAFHRCYNLPSVTIPKSVTSIGDGAFAGCLSNIYVSEGNANYSSVDGVLFNQDCTTLVAYPSGRKDRSYEIPDGVVSIGNNAFVINDYLDSVTIPKSVTTIGNYAILSCHGLAYVAIPEGVASIGEGAFKGCDGLTNVRISESVTSIGVSAFDGCSSLKNVYYTGTQAQWDEIEIGDNNAPLRSATLNLVSDGLVASGSCGENLTWSIDEEGTLTISGTGAMWDYDYVSVDGVWHTTAPWYSYSPTKLVLNEGITYIGYYAFQQAEFTGSLTLPESLTSIGSFAFDGCDGFTGTLVLPEGLTSVGGYAFWDCKGFTGDLILPESLTNIGWGAFQSCSGLTSVTIPKSVKEILGAAFSDCSSLSNIIVNGNTSYDAADGVLFNKDHTTLLCYPAGKENTAYEIPEGVTKINNSAFSGCSNLDSVTIPRSVTKRNEHRLGRLL